jgi:hypothetical protein
MQDYKYPSEDLEKINICRICGLNICNICVLNMMIWLNGLFNNPF